MTRNSRKVPFSQKWGNYPTIHIFKGYFNPLPNMNYHSCKSKLHVILIIQSTQDYLIRVSQILKYIYIKQY